MTVRARLEFKPQDCWVGVYWKTEDTVFAGRSLITDPITIRVTYIWLCLVPMLPLRISWRRTPEGELGPCLERACGVESARR